MKVEGMMCDGCSGRIEEALKVSWWMLDCKLAKNSCQPGTDLQCVVLSMEHLSMQPHSHNPACVDS